MKPIIKKLSLLLAVALTAACGDMKLQTDADYDHSVLDPHIPMTAWEYFETRTDIFSEFMAAVEYAGMKEYYTQTGREYTFLALTNTAVKAFVSTYPDKSKITDCPKEDVQNLLRYHIIDGFYSGYGELPVEAIFVLTLRRGEEGLMTMLTRKNPWMADAGAIIVNDTGTNGNSPNIMPTNGVIHVFDSYCYYRK